MHLRASLILLGLSLSGLAPVFGQSTIYNGPFTHVTGSSPNLSYDTGGLLTVLSDGQNYLGLPATLGGAGGFVVSSSTNDSRPEAMVSLEDFWQDESSNPVLILGSGIFCEGNIDLGTDTTITRQIDVVSSATNEGVAFVFGVISGSGNLLIQNYLTTASSGGFIPPTLYVETSSNSTTPALNISGQLTLNNVYLWNNIQMSNAVSAGSYNLSGAEIVAEVADTGTPDVTLSNYSAWFLDVFNTSNVHSIGNLTSDSTSTVYFSYNGLTAASTLTVHSGYLAGILSEGGSGSSTYQGTLIKDGPGIFTLANDNTATNYGPIYSGGTIVKQGTLLTANTSGSATSAGPVTVMSGGAIGGTGFIHPPTMEVESGGMIDLTAFDAAHAPASSTNAFTITLSGRNGIATFDSGAGFAFDFGSGGSSDTLNFLGVQFLSPPFGPGPGPRAFFNNNNVKFNFLPGATPGTYTLFSFSYPGYYTGTLQNGPYYYFTYSPTSITVTILAIPESFSSWAGQKFNSTQAADPTISGPSVSPQNDGVPNLLKYLFDINPTAPMSASDRAALPTAGMTTISGLNYLTLTYRQNMIETGITINVQTSPDLQTWTTVTPDNIVNTGPDPVTGDPLMQVQVKENPQGAAKEFIRLNVTMP